MDTHKDEHVGVTVDGLDGRLNELFIPATNDGYQSAKMHGRSLTGQHRLDEPPP